MKPNMRPILKQVAQLWSRYGWKDYDDAALKAADIVARGELSQKSIAKIPSNFFAFNKVSRKELLRVLSMIKIANNDSSTVPAGILVLLASPTFATRIRVDKEYRAIYNSLSSSTNRDHFPLHVLTATEPTDMINIINKTKPSILQVSSHGNPDGLLLDGASASQGALRASQLDKIVATIDPPVKIVILNACQSSDQAKVLTKYADIAIGMSANIGDNAAIAFSGQFYASLAEGCSVGVAFDQALVNVGMVSPGYTDVPRLFTKRGVDASKYYFKSEEE